MAANQLRELRELSAGDLHAGGLGPGLQPDRQLEQHGGVGLLDREVVHERERLGAHADEVVDVHRHAVDPHGVEAPRLLGDDHLRAHAVRAQGDTEVRTDLQDARVVPGVHHGARRPAGVDRAQHADQAGQRVGRLAGVDPGAGVGVGHRDRFFRTARTSTAPASPAR